MFKKYLNSVFCVCFNKSCAIHLLSLLTTRIFTKKWLHILQSRTIPGSDYKPKFIPSWTQIFSRNEFSFKPTCVCTRYFHCLLYVRTVRFMYFYECPTHLILTKKLSTFKYEPIYKPCQSYISSRSNFCIIRANWFTTSITT